jgi:hypothetical protein
MCRGCPPLEHAAIVGCVFVLFGWGLAAVQNIESAAKRGIELVINFWPNNLTFKRTKSHSPSWEIKTCLL